MRSKVTLLTALAILLFFSVAGAEEIRYDKGARRDPFLPLIGPNAVVRNMGVGQNDFSIEGVIFDPKGSSYAVIGGEIYREGESIGTAKLIRVLTDRVILNQESKDVIIWIREEIVQQQGSSGDKSHPK